MVPIPEMVVVEEVEDGRRLAGTLTEQLQVVEDPLPEGSSDGQWYPVNSNVCGCFKCLAPRA